MRSVSLLMLFLLLAIGGPAVAHGILVDSMPKSGETVAVGVSQVALRFNSRIEPALSRLRLTGPSGDLVRLRAQPSAAGPNWLTAALPGLQAGLYTVHWRVFTVDGRVSHGSFSFRVARSVEEISRSPKPGPAVEW